jgi:hypothetical protein
MGCLKGHDVLVKIGSRVVSNCLLTITFSFKTDFLERTALDTVVVFTAIQQHGTFVGTFGMDSGPDKFAGCQVRFMSTGTFNVENGDTPTFAFVALEFTVASTG